MAGLFDKDHIGHFYSTLLITIVVFTSCDFHVVKNIGPQISSNAERSKEVGAFVAKYKMDSSENAYVSKIDFKSIFIERKYSSDGGLFSGYKIADDEMQLVFRSVEYLSDYHLKYGKDWELIGFKKPYSNCLYRSVSADFVADTLIIKYVLSKDSVEIEGDLVLYKVE